MYACRVFFFISTHNTTSHLVIVSYISFIINGDVFNTKVIVTANWVVHSRLITFNVNVTTMGKSPWFNFKVVMTYIRPTENSCPKVG